MTIDTFMGLIPIILACIAGFMLGREHGRQLGTTVALEMYRPSLEQANARILSDNQEIEQLRALLGKGPYR